MNIYKIKDILKKISKKNYYKIIRYGRLIEHKKILENIINKKKYDLLINYNIPIKNKIIFEKYIKNLKIYKEFTILRYCIYINDLKAFKLLFHLIIVNKYELLINDMALYGRPDFILYMLNYQLKSIDNYFNYNVLIYSTMFNEVDLNITKNLFTEKQKIDCFLLMYNYIIKSKKLDNLKKMIFTSDSIKKCYYNLIDSSKKKFLIALNKNTDFLSGYNGECSLEIMSRHGQLELMRWIIKENKLNISSMIYIGAIEAGRINTFKYAFINRFSKYYTKDLFYIALRKGHLNIMSWIVKYDLDCYYEDSFKILLSEYILIGCSYLDGIKWIFENLVPIKEINTSDVFDHAITNGRYDVFLYLLYNHNYNSFSKMSINNIKEKIKYYRTNSRIVDYKILEGGINIIKFINENKNKFIIK